MLKLYSSFYSICNGCLSSFVIVFANMFRAVCIIFFRITTLYMLMVTSEYRCSISGNDYMNGYDYCNSKVGNVEMFVRVCK